MTPTQKPAELLISQTIDLIAHILWSCLFALLPLFSCNFDTREGGLSLNNLMQSFFWSSPILIALFRELLWCSFELSLHSSRCPVCLLIGCGHGLDCLPAPAAGLAKRAGRDGAESGRGVVTKRHGRWENEWLFRRAFLPAFSVVRSQLTPQKKSTHARVLRCSLFWRYGK